MKDICAAKPPRELLKHGLLNFAILVKRLVTHANQLQQQLHLNNLLLEQQIIEKLRDEHKDGWGEIKRNNPRANLSDMASYLLARTKGLSAAPPEKITRTTGKKPTPMVGVTEDLTFGTSELEDEDDVELLGVVRRPNPEYKCFDCSGRIDLSTVEYSSIDRSMAG